MSLSKSVEVGTAMIGYGPAGVGSYAALVREGFAPAVHEHGLAVVNSTLTVGSGEIALLDSKGNSGSVDFPQGIPFEHVLAADAAQRLMRQGDTPPESLQREVAPFLEGVGDASLADIRGSGGVILLGQSAHQFEQVGDPRDPQYVGQTDAGNNIFTNSLVLATGAEEVLSPAWERYGAGDRVVTSGQVIRGEADDVIDKAVANGQKLGIQGGSHSGIYVAKRMIDRYGTDLQPGQILVVHRHPLRVHRDGQNRFGGVRHEQRDLVERVQHGDESRVEFRQIPRSDAGARVLSDETAVPVQATGYQPRRVSITREGREIGPGIARDGRLTVDDQSRVRGHDRRVLVGVWANGLGAALNAPGERNVRQDGVNMFVNDQGYLVANGVARRARNLAA